VDILAFGFMVQTFGLICIRIATKQQRGKILLTATWRKNQHALSVNTKQRRLCFGMTFGGQKIKLNIEGSIEKIFDLYVHD